jgi:adenosylhomocysteine nucleosidase
MTPTSSGPIGILCALPEEQALLVEALGDPPPLPGAALEARGGRLDGREVVVAAAGVGKVKAASTAGLGPDLGIGDIVIADRVIDIDYGRLTDAGRIVYQPGTLPLPEVKPEPGYRLAADTADRVRRQLAAAGFPAVLGTIVTGDAFLASPRVRDELAAEWDALAIEMEGSAVCGVAVRFEVPWLVVRALSDRAGEDSVGDFGAFVSSAAAASARLVRALLPVFDD